MSNRNEAARTGAGAHKSGGGIRLRRRHIIVRTLLGPLVWLFCRAKNRLRLFSFEKEGRGVKPPCLIIANHNSDLDPLWVSLCFSFPIFYVASDHLFRMGTVSRLLRWLVSPIPKLKTKSDVHTVRDILTALRSGASVGIFPEGQRSWNGETEEIAPAIGKLIHRLSVPLVICRIHGGYLAAPRWGDRMRRGPVEVRLVRALSPEQLRGMSAEELNALILRDLYLSADEDQREAQSHYHCKNPAQSLETLLYACPSCHRLATLRSQGDTAACDCGLTLRYRDDGRLTGGPFHTLLQWDRWQTGHLRERLRELSENSVDAPLFSDPRQRLYSFTRADRDTLMDTGSLSLYTDRLVFEGELETRVYPLPQILDMDIWGRLTLQFSMADGGRFEVRSDHPRSAYKYQQAFKILKGASEQG